LTHFAIANSYIQLKKSILIIYFLKKLLLTSLHSIDFCLLKLPDIGEVLLVVPDKSISYPNVEFFKEKVIKSAAVVNTDLIAFDGSFIISTDTTTIKVRLHYI